MTALEQVCEELRELGYFPNILRPEEINYTLAIIDYDVQHGRYKQRKFKIGIGFQEDAYPEYPPHWIGVACLPEARIPEHTSFRYNDSEWKVFSVPPNDFWDTLPTSEKNMEIYFRRHLIKFWSQV